MVPRSTNLRSILSQINELASPFMAPTSSHNLTTSHLLDHPMYSRVKRALEAAALKLPWDVQPRGAVDPRDVCAIISFLAHDEEIAQKLGVLLSQHAAA